MPICTPCGFRNVEGARFCGNCGAQVSAVAIPNPPVWTGALPPRSNGSNGSQQICTFTVPANAVTRISGAGSAIVLGFFLTLLGFVLLPMFVAGPLVTIIFVIISLCGGIRDGVCPNCNAQVHTNCLRPRLRCRDCKHRLVVRNRCIFDVT